MRRPVALAVLLCWGATAAEAGEGAKPPARFWIELGVGWSWTRGNDVRVAQTGTASVSEPVCDLSIFVALCFDLDSNFQPVRTVVERDTALLFKAGYAGESWGVDAQLWHLRPRGAADVAFERLPEDPTFPTLLLWGNPFNTSGDYGFEADNELSLDSGRVELTRAMGSKLSLAFGVHVARYENERVETLIHTRPRAFLSFDSSTESSVLTSEAEGWMVGPSLGLRFAARPGRDVGLALSLSQSVLFADIDHEGRFSTVEQTDSGQPLGELDVSTRFSSRASVPVSEARGAVTWALSDNFSIGLVGLVSVWHELPAALQFSIAESDDVWLEQKSTLVFSYVGPTLRLRF